MDPGMQMKHIFKARPMTHKNEYKWLYLQFYRWLYLDTSLYLPADPCSSFNSQAIAGEKYSLHGFFKLGHTVCYKAYHTVWKWF